MPDRLGDDVRLKYILDAISSIEEYTSSVSFEEFQIERMRKDATLRQLEIIGEATSRLSTQLKADHPSVDWSSIIGLRNLVIHEYFGVDLNTVWNIIKQDIPPFRSTIEILHQDHKN
ncbi:MAG: DUF86 domain-containing protein [Leeuwenhoekiella sp.]